MVVGAVVAAAVSVMAFAGLGGGGIGRAGAFGGFEAEWLGVGCGGTERRRRGGRRWRGHVSGGRSVVECADSVASSDSNRAMVCCELNMKGEVMFWLRRKALEI